uniref:Uncharacterized protein n=1 Tax=Oryza glumipatula TaxID=40148 RepID=A0A0D9YTC0_9ORYZ
MVLPPLTGGTRLLPPRGRARPVYKRIGMDDMYDTNSDLLISAWTGRVGRTPAGEGQPASLPWTQVGLQGQHRRDQTLAAAGFGTLPTSSMVEDRFAQDEGHYIDNSHRHIPSSGQEEGSCGHDVVVPNNHDGYHDDLDLDILFDCVVVPVPGGHLNSDAAVFIPITVGSQDLYSANATAYRHLHHLRNHHKRLVHDAETLERAIENSLSSVNSLALHRGGRCLIMELMNAIKSTGRAGKEKEKE